MTKLQRIYRTIRPHLSRDDARYAAPRLLAHLTAFYAARSGEVA